MALAKQSCPAPAEPNSGPVGISSLHFIHFLSFAPNGLFALCPERWAEPHPQLLRPAPQRVSVAVGSTPLSEGNHLHRRFSTVMGSEACASGAWAHAGSPWFWRASLETSSPPKQKHVPCCLVFKIHAGITSSPLTPQCIFCFMHCAKQEITEKYQLEFWWVTYLQHLKGREGKKRDARDVTTQLPQRCWKRRDLWQRVSVNVTKGTRQIRDHL